jgi:conjugative relaxase-like TrwC/TraI family protein
VPDGLSRNHELVDRVASPTVPSSQSREVFGSGVPAMMSIRRISLGAGYRYLMESVAVGDGAKGQPSDLIAYYAASGTPPGMFMGAGLAALGLEAGETVTEEHLFRMLGMLADPVTGQPLGRTPPKTAATLAQRIAARVAAIPDDVSPVERAELIATIEAEENSRTPRAGGTVAGFDLTFSPAKGSSVAWALADTETKQIIFDCHREAIEIVLAFAEAEVFHSRSGAGGSVEEDIEGIIAAAFTHFDSRDGDPQLHDHVVIWNRARSVADGQWRTLDSRQLYKATVMLSELHTGVLADLLTARLGWGWEEHPGRRTERPRLEVAGISQALLGEFSQRSTAIEERSAVLIEGFVVSRGRRPTSTEVIRLRQQATLETRPDKTYRSLADMTADWRSRAMPFVGDQPESWVASLAGRNDLPLLRSADLADEILADVATVALAKVGEKRATFSRFNVAAEVHRQLHAVRFAHPTERIHTAARAVDLALGEARLLSPPELRHTPEMFRRPDGTSRFRATGHEVYTTAAIMEAEARLLDAGRQISAPAVAAATVETLIDDRVSIDQAVAVEAVATSGRRVDLLVGPAGSGKTTTMATLRAAWEAEHGPGSVIGLAPSAVAAEVLSDELGVETENTAKWLHEHRQNPWRRGLLDRLHAKLADGNLTLGTATAIQGRIRAVQGDLQRWSLRAGQLVIVDEASLAGTLALDELATAASDAGAKLLLVGDDAQLSAVEAGGMFKSLVADRDGHAPILIDVRRFSADWEKQASVRLRVGDPVAIDTYASHGRIVEGARDEILDAALQAWRTDIEAGRTSLMIAPDAATVSELNRRARADLVTAGQVEADGVEVADGSIAGVGDQIVTRQNDRTLTAGRRWVRNGDHWTVTAIADNGSITARSHNAASVVLPSDYVAHHVELAYAATAHRAQGRTTDTAHAVVWPTTTREVLYVSSTRGRHANCLYVDTRYDPDPSTGHDGVLQPQTAREVLIGVLGREGADVSAHEALHRAHDQAESIATLAGEYQTIAGAAQRDHWESLLARSGLSPTQIQVVKDSSSYEALAAALRYAPGVDKALPSLIAQRTLINADDLAAVLQHRVDTWANNHERPDNLVAGVIPRAQPAADLDLARGLHEREHAIETRATTRAERAAASLAPWIGRLGRPPTDPMARSQWLQAVTVVAAYRDRWDIKDDPQPLGPETTISTEQAQQRQRAFAAARRAFTISRTPVPAASAPQIEQRGIEL